MKLFEKRMGKCKITHVRKGDFLFEPKGSDTYALIRYEGPSAVKRVLVPRHVLHKDVVEIGPSVFGDKPGIEAILVPLSLKRIADRAFYNCPELKVVCGALFATGISEMSILPRGLEELGKEAFLGTKMSSVIVLGKNVRIGDRCFKGTPLNELVYHTSIQIGEDAFGGNMEVICDGDDWYHLKRANI